MMKPALTALAAAAILVATTDDAHAAGRANGFGEKGELIISADRLVPLFGYTHSSVTFPGNNNNGQLRESSVNASGMSFLFGRDLSSYDGSILGQPFNVHSIPRVAFDITIIDKLTLGMGLAFAFGFGGSIKNEQVIGPNATRTTKTDAPTTTAIGLAPRVGYIIPLGEWLAFWPRAGFAFYSVSAKTETLDNNNNVVATSKVSDSYFSIDLDPQLAIIPTEHFFFTVGPMLNIPIAGGRTFSTTAGARTTEEDDDISLLHFGIHASIGGFIDIF
jgi:hypothetical protein